MEKKGEPGLQGDQKAQGVWERRTADRRYGQNQLFGSFRVDSGGPAVSRNDPTDSALAAIASILEKPAGRPLGGADQKPAQAAQARVSETQVPNAPATEPQTTEPQTTEAEDVAPDATEAGFPEPPAAEVQTSEPQILEPQVSHAEVADGPVPEAPVSHAPAEPQAPPLPADPD